MKCARKSSGGLLVKLARAFQYRKMGFGKGGQSLTLCEGKELKIVGGAHGE